MDYGFAAVSVWDHNKWMAQIGGERQASQGLPTTPTKKTTNYT